MRTGARPERFGVPPDEVCMPEQHRARVLVVDDDKELAFILRANLASAGYHAEDVHDAETALARLDSFQPDLVVMDLSLPGMSGIEATRRIKQCPSTSDIEVIMVTGRSESDNVVMALEAGAVEYVIKPFEVVELLARIRTVHRLRETRKELDLLNAELSVQVEERTSRLRILYNFTRSLNEAHTRDRILDLTLRAVNEATGSKRISILLKTEDGRHLACARAVGIDEDVVEQIRIPADSGIAGSVFATGKTFVANAYDGDSTADASGTHRYASETFVSTPLIATTLMTSDETLGVLSITDRPGSSVFTPDEVECIRSIADSSAIALHDLLHRERLDESVDVLLMTVGRLSEFRDNETCNHLERVREYARLLAAELGASPKYAHIVNEQFIEDIHRAAPMHDIGKVGIADDILCKPGKLTEEEFTAMKEHCAIGRKVIESAMAKTGPVPILQMCVEIAGSHHERYNGSGYPDGLAGTEIPLPARIIALVDAYDAITSKRRYKDEREHGDAVETIRADAGTHFDPELIQPFLNCADDFDRIRRAHSDCESDQEVASLSCASES